jgi:hypothetical protein
MTQIKFNALSTALTTQHDGRDAANVRKRSHGLGCPCCSENSLCISKKATHFSNELMRKLYRKSRDYILEAANYFLWTDRI